MSDHFGTLCIKGLNWFEVNSLKANLTKNKKISILIDFEK